MAGRRAGTTDQIWRGGSGALKTGKIDVSRRPSVEDREPFRACARPLRYHRHAVFVGWSPRHRSSPRRRLFMSERSYEYLGSTALLPKLAVRDGSGDIAQDAVVVTMYGGVMMFRAYCVDCRKNAFVEGGRLVCCLEVVNPTRIIQARVATKVSGRNPIRDRERDELVASQGGLCFYCDRAFWSEVYLGVRTIVLRPNVDHFIPYVYSQSDQRSNKVAACHVCNGFKNAIVFIDTDAARAYLSLRWRKKGYRDAE